MKQASNRVRNDHATLRLHHRRRRLGRLRAGKSAERGSERARAAAGSRRLGHRSADPHSARHRHDAQAHLARLGLPQRAGAQSRRPQGRGDARQGAGRLVLDQRHRLHARRSAATTTAGRRKARSAGPTRTCCRTSSAPRPGSTARATTRGGDGPIGVEWARVADPIYDAWLEAGKAAGYRIITDNSAGDTEGFARSQYTIRNGRRSSASTAYLKPALRRSNLTLMTRVLAGKVLIEGQRAVGIELIRAWRDRTGAGGARGHIWRAARSTRRNS